ncbi:MAG: RidA family protein [Eubacteriales bacterium]|nr:RidA family protein [Eubacteriales bacterium]
MDIARFEQDHRMSDVVVYKNTAYIGGQICTQRDGIRAQAADTLALIDHLLSLCGSEKSRILYATIYLLDMSNLPEFNEIWDAWIERGYAPARACVGVQMANPRCLVEIALTAACG